MGNGYNHNHLHHQNLHLQHKGTFLPMLCSRPSIKEVTLSKWEDRSVSFSRDPLSPKIGCMGQVKRNNKIVGFPTSNNKFTITTKKDTTSTTTTTIKYSKLKRIFSGKSLTSTTTMTSTITSYRRRQGILNGESGLKRCVCKENSVSINIDEMDPPLPVIKKVQKQADGEEVNSLWKRRCGGVQLKNLQLQHVQLSTRHLEPTTV